MDLPKRSDGQLPLNYRLCTEGKQRFYVSAIFGSSHLEFVEARFKSYSLIRALFVTSPPSSFLLPLRTKGKNDTT